MISIVELARVNGAVGRATPSRTGAISESAVSHSSSTASLINAWKTLLHFTNGWDMLFNLEVNTKYMNKLKNSS